ncbi:MAG: transporter substrate-binding domain-containing protein [Anaerolineae bacterium]|jgi:polar amino acid transport system substrate-binding protein
MSTALKIVLIALAAIALIAICVIVALLVFRPGEPEPTAVPPTVAATATGEGAVDDSWERVQAAGKMIVGTAANYPPFEYYIEDLRIDGFDIALMDEIGRRLGVQIDYRDFAFDGLGGALQLGQIDAAIAAISVVAEREALVDFTNVYFVGEDAALAREDSTITLSSVDDLAQYKVGVERGSVYQDWLQTELVDTGKMPAGNLLVYEKAGDAVRDLTQQRLDLVVADLQPAEVAVAAGGVKIVGQGLNQQRYAIALPKGAQALAAEINRVLNDLHNEGVIAELAKRYLNVDTLLPTPTPAATSTAAPPAGCVDGLTFVSHPDGQGNPDNPIQAGPGQRFTKVWRVKNTGTCTWDSNYELVFSSGARMSGQPTPVQAQVAPGQEYDIAVNFVAPQKGGTYQSIWQMINAQGTGFGERLKVSVVVTPGPTVTPAPTNTPTPGIVFTVDRDQIKQGECVTFSWKVDNVKEVYFYAEGEDWRDNGVTGEGSQQECPPATITYYLRVVLRDNSVVTQSIRIDVQPATGAPVIKRFTVDPKQITTNQCVNIQWTVEGQVTDVKLTANNNTLWDGAPTSGSYSDCPTAAGNVTYNLSATGSGGTSQASETIRVNDPSTATPAPTAAPDKPVIYSFSVSPNQIADGDYVDLNWSTGGGTSQVDILKDGQPFIQDADLTGYAQDQPSPAGSYTYQVVASNAAGEQVTQQKSVNVADTTPENPLADTFWTATVISGQTVSGTLTTNFDASGGVNGFAGCNSYSGSYTVNGNSLSIGSVSAGLALCDQATNDQETAFLSALGSAGSFTMEMGLIISDGSGTAVLEYTASGP